MLEIKEYTNQELVKDMEYTRDYLEGMLPDDTDKHMLERYRELERELTKRED